METLKQGITLKRDEYFKNRLDLGKYIAILQECKKDFEDKREYFKKNSESGMLSLFSKR